MATKVSLVLTVNQFDEVRTALRWYMSVLSRTKQDADAKDDHLLSGVTGARYCATKQILSVLEASA